MWFSEALGTVHVYSQFSLTTVALIWFSVNQMLIHSVFVIPVVGTVCGNCWTIIFLCLSVSLIVCLSRTFSSSFCQ